MGTMVFLLESKHRFPGREQLTRYCSPLFRRPRPKLTHLGTLRRHGDDPELDLRRSFIVWKNDHRAAIAGHFARVAFGVNCITIELAHAQGRIAASP